MRRMSSGGMPPIDRTNRVLTWDRMPEQPPGARRWHVPRGTLAAIAVLFALCTAVGVARASGPHDLDRDTVRALIVDRAIAHGADPDTMLGVAWCESRYTPRARGKFGEYGLFQWLPPVERNAWGQTTAAAMGISIAERYEVGDPDAPYYDADGAAEMFSRGQALIRIHWRMTYGRRC